MTDQQLTDVLRTYYETLHGNQAVVDYHQRHSIESALIQTNYTDEHAGLVAEYLRPRIEGKVIVEIGGGIGLLGCHLAMIAKRVYCIEADPSWMSCFVHVLYREKPKNLTYIFGAAEEAPPIYSDVALFCTHSGHQAMYQAATRFAPVVIDVYAELLAQMENREAA